MNIIEQGEAISLSIQSSEKKGREKKRLFSLCRERFQSAILSIPDDEDTLTNYGIQTTHSHLKNQPILL